MLDKTYWKNHMEKFQDSVPCKPRFEIGSIVYIAKECSLHDDKYRCPHCGGLSLLYSAQEAIYRKCPYCSNGYIDAPYKMYFPTECVVIGYRLVNRKYEDEMDYDPVGRYDDWRYYLSAAACGYYEYSGHEIYISERECQQYCDKMTEKNKEEYIKRHADEVVYTDAEDDSVLPD